MTADQYAQLTKLRDQSKEYQTSLDKLTAEVTPLRKENTELKAFTLVKLFHVNL